MNNGTKNNETSARKKEIYEGKGTKKQIIV